MSYGETPFLIASAPNGARNDPRSPLFVLFVFIDGF